MHRTRGLFLTRSHWPSSKCINVAFDPLLDVQQQFSENNPLLEWLVKSVKEQSGFLFSGEARAEFK